MIQEKRLVDEFIELVKVDSETRFEQEISKVLKQKFSALGLSVDEDDSSSRSGHGSNNLFFTLAPNSDKPLPRLFSLLIWTRSHQAKALNHKLEQTVLSAATVRRFSVVMTKQAWPLC